MFLSLHQRPVTKNQLIFFGGFWLCIPVKKNDIAKHFLFSNWNNNKKRLLILGVWILVTRITNEKNTSQVFLWNFIPLRIVYLSLDTERRQFKEKFPTHDSTMKQILVLETPFKVLVYFFWNTNFLQFKVLYHFNM